MEYDPHRRVSILRDERIGKSKTGHERERRREYTHVSSTTSRVTPLTAAR
jgi:hypothetical protein